VYVAGVLLGRPPLAHQGAISRFLDGAASMMQIAVFVLLGLLSFPSRLAAGTGAGLGVAAVLVFLARPAAVWLSLAAVRRFFPAARFTTRETIMIAWAGLRGAVPIIFALTPLLRGVEGADRLFDVVFFAVLVSAVVQGSTAAAVARRLGLATPEPPRAPAMLEIASDAPITATFLDLAIDSSSPLLGRAVSELGLPESAVIAAVWRDGHVLPVRGKTVLAAGDHVYLLVDPGSESAVVAAFPARRVVAE
jgi:cell volume regulation protein A